VAKESKDTPHGASRADDSRVYFDNVAGKNTCSGDSGGPAFYRDQTMGTLLLTAITSIGDKNCTWGAETRLHAYREWIVTHTRDSSFAKMFRRRLANCRLDRRSMCEPSYPNIP
jgi:secreted trypsin-like serine protease